MDYNISHSHNIVLQTGQRSISCDVEVDVPINGDGSIDDHFPTTKPDTVLHEHRNLLNSTLSPDRNMLVNKINVQKFFVKENTVLSFISLTV